LPWLNFVCTSIANQIYSLMILQNGFHLCHDLQNLLTFILSVLNVEDTGLAYNTTTTTKKP